MPSLIKPEMSLGFMIAGTLYAWSASVLGMSKTFYELKLKQVQSTALRTHISTQQGVSEKHTMLTQGTERSWSHVEPMHCSLIGFGSPQSGLVR